MRARRVLTYVGEIQVECDQDAIFVGRGLEDRGVGLAPEPFVQDGRDIVPFLSEPGRRIAGHILIQLEPQCVTSVWSG